MLHNNVYILINETLFYYFIFFVYVITKCLLLLLVETLQLAKSKLFKSVNVPCNCEESGTNKNCRLHRVEMIHFKVSIGNYNDCFIIISSGATLKRARGGKSGKKLLVVNNWTICSNGKSDTGNWKSQCQAASNDFPFLERVQSQECVSLTHCRLKMSSNTHAIILLPHLLMSFRHLIFM